MLRLWELLKLAGEAYLRWEMANPEGRGWTMIPVAVVVCLIALFLLWLLVKVIVLIVTTPRKIHFRLVFGVWQSRSSEDLRIIQERVNDVLGTHALELKKLFEKQNEIYAQAPSLEKTNGLLQVNKEISRSKIGWRRLSKLVKGCGYEAKKPEDYWPKEEGR